MKGNFNWIDDMYKIEMNYNNTIHKSLEGHTPDEIFYKKLKLIGLFQF